MKVRGWVKDLVVGVRLAVGGGRTSAARLALSALGISIAAAVLLVAASVGTMTENRMERQFTDMPSDQPVAGVAPTYYARTTTEFRNDQVQLSYVWADTPGSPKPDALPALPKPGEMYVSPALAELLRSDEGRLLRPRLPEKIVGMLDKSLVIEPGFLVAWVGADSSIADSEFGREIYDFHPERPLISVDAGMLSLLLIGAVVLLLPVLTFVSTASRIAGAERDRRLSALRLVGAGSWQVRRIAAAESLVSAVIGMAVGGTIFAVGRLYADDIDLFDERVYSSDVVPDPVLAVVVMLLIPVLSVLTALFALRRTIIEPLGVVRQSKPIRRRAWWRLAMVALGVVLLLTQLGATAGSDGWAWAIAGGATFLLVGMLVLLPWLVERVANRITGGPPSWMLAIRRLQLDSGTSARVVGGVAVVLAGMIALQSVLLSIDATLGLPGESKERQGVVQVSAPSALAGDVERNLAGAEGVQSTAAVHSTAVYKVGETDTAYSLDVLDCASLRDLAGIKDCEDGDVFQTSDRYQQPPAPGTALEFHDYEGEGSDWNPTRFVVTGHWTMPDNVKTVTLQEDTLLFGSIFATPGALGTQQVDSSTTVVAKVSKTVTSDQLEQIRNAVADFRWESYVFSYNTAPELTSDQEAFLAIRTALYAGSVITLMLAGVSLLVLALEHIRERRRPLAVLAASGVPKGVLGRSLLWQVALPITLGVVMALITGVGLAAMMIRLSNESLTIDWPGVSVLCVGAIALSLLVSAMTLPFLNSATRLTTLRTE